MDIHFIDNQNQKLAAILLSEITLSKQTRIAVAFVSQAGLSKLERAMKTALEAGGEIEMVVGLDFSTTEPNALWTMHHWATENPGFKYFCSPVSRPVYHPKMYLMRGPETEIVIVGSSNLTAGGLLENAEANLYIKDISNSQVFSDAEESYLRLKFDGRRIPDSKFLATYEEKSKLSASRGKRASGLASLLASIEPEFAGLPKPKATSKDLAGWLKLVYESIPEGEFTNDDVYKHEEKFQVSYPANQNIHAKIRQQLQLLRDIGLIEPISRGVWRRA